MKLLIILLVFVLDRERPPYPYITQSENGRYYFKMSPSKNAPYDRDLGYGFAFKLDTGQTDKLIWKTKKWYGFETHLSNDGEHLIRIGNIPRGKKVSDKHLAIAFYKKGMLIKKYSTKRLLGDFKVRSTVSHYQFQDGEAGILSETKQTFKLPLINKKDVIFNFATGQIISGAKPERPEFMSDPFSNDLNQKKQKKSVKKKN